MVWVHGDGGTYVCVMHGHDLDAEHDLTVEMAQSRLTSRLGLLTSPDDLEHMYSE